nr:hypothetical protein [Armatimonadota bacterium]
HPATGRRCHFLDDEEEPIPDPVAALAEVRTLPAAQVEEVIAALTRADSPGPVEAKSGVPRDTKADADPVARLLEGCGVLRALAERARQTGHLRHTHNLILLYTVGRLGEPGAEFLHRTLAQCRNYDARICQGYLDRLDAQHSPLSCRRIREWLEEEGESGLCDCAPGRRSPLDILKGIPSEQTPSVKKRVPKPRPLPPSLPSEAEDGLQEAWQAVVADLFTEPPPIENGAEAAEPVQPTLFDEEMP